MTYCIDCGQVMDFNEERTFYRCECGMTFELFEELTIRYKREKK